MKAFFNRLKVKAAKAVRNAEDAVANVLGNTRGEGYVDSGVKILIAVVIGALLLAGLYALFNNTIMPTVTQKVQDLFNYAG
ncbi:MAG: DUF6133 family protein [Clostridiales bacterium]|nr:DUF6133 family protein [Clostridiales bacterium]